MYWSMDFVGTYCFYYNKMEKCIRFLPSIMLAKKKLTCMHSLDDMPLFLFHHGGN